MQGPRGGLLPGRQLEVGSHQGAESRTAAVRSECVGQGSVERQSQWERYGTEETLYEGLAHATVEAERAHDLPAAGWGPGGRRCRSV